MRAGNLRVIRGSSTKKGKVVLVLSVEDEVGQLPWRRVEVLEGGEVLFVPLHWLEMNSDDINEAR